MYWSLKSPRRDYRGFTTKGILTPLWLYLGTNISSDWTDRDWINVYFSHLKELISCENLFYCPVSDPQMGMVLCIISLPMPPSTHVVCFTRYLSNDFSHLFRFDRIDDTGLQIMDVVCNLHIFNFNYRICFISGINGPIATEGKRTYIDWMLGLKCGLQYKSWSWHRPWIFNVKCWIYYIPGKWSNCHGIQDDQLNTRPQIRPSTLTLAPALTLNFQAQLFKLLHHMKLTDCHETKIKHADWTLGVNGGFNFDLGHDFSLFHAYDFNQQRDRKW